MCWAGLWSETSHRSSAGQSTSAPATGCQYRPGSQYDAGSEDHPLYLQVIGQIENNVGVCKRFHSNFQSLHNSVGKNINDLNESEVKVPGSVVCSQVTPSWPSRGRFVMLVT